MIYEIFFKMFIFRSNHSLEYAPPSYSEVLGESYTPSTTSARPPSPTEEDSEPPPTYDEAVATLQCQQVWSPEAVMIMLRLLATPAHLSLLNRCLFHSQMNHYHDHLSRCAHCMADFSIKIILILKMMLKWKEKLLLW